MIQVWQQCYDTAGIPIFLSLPIAQLIVRVRCAGLFQIFPNKHARSASATELEQNYTYVLKNKENTKKIIQHTLNQMKQKIF